METLRFKANGQRLHAERGLQRYASETVNYIKAEFKTDAKWTGFDVVRAVWKNNRTSIITILEDDMTCNVPQEMLSAKALVQVNLVGCVYEDGQLVTRLTTYPVLALEIDKKAEIEGNETAPVTPSQFDQFVAIVSDGASAVIDAKDAALQAATEARENAERTAANSNRARDAADEAELAVVSAAGSASDASAYAIAADNSAATGAVYAEAASLSAEAAAESEANALIYAQRAEEAADPTVGMTAEAVTLPAGDPATASYSEGVLTLGIPQGIQGDPGIPGEQGVPGNDGADGVTPDIQIGTVTTLPAGSSATASITGTAELPLLNLGIPKGADGGGPRENGDVLTTSIPASTKTNVASVDLGAGTWVVTFQIGINIPAAGVLFQATISTSSDVSAQQLSTAVSGMHRHNVTAIITVTGPVTVYGTAYHTHSTSLTSVQNDLRAIRIA